MNFLYFSALQLNYYICDTFKAALQLRGKLLQQLKNKTENCILKEKFNCERLLSVLLQNVFSDRNNSKKKKKDQQLGFINAPSDSALRLNYLENSRCVNVSNKINLNDKKPGK